MPIEYKLLQFRLPLADPDVASTQMNVLASDGYQLISQEIAAPLAIMLCLFARRSEIQSMIARIVEDAARQGVQIDVIHPQDGPSDVMRN